MKNILSIFTAASLVLLAACESAPTADNATTSTTDTIAQTSSAQEETKRPVTKVRYFHNGKYTPPTGTTFSGMVMEAATWEDSNGFNFILLTLDEDIEEYSEEYQDLVQSRFLHGYHFTYEKSGDTPELLWSVVDMYEECEFDLIVYFQENSLEITDLNDNGIAESVFMYKADCASDYSPMTLKLLMHEGETKYALRGTSRVDYGESEQETSYGGEYEIDPSFKTAPKLFEEFATEKWEDFVEL